MNEGQVKQRSLLLDDGPRRSLPKDIEDQLLELLVQLLIGVIPAIEEGGHDEQDHH